MLPLMADTSRTRSRYDLNQVLGSLLVLAVAAAILGGFLWFVVAQVAKLDSEVAGAAIGAAATVLVSIVALFIGRRLERNREVELSAREKRIPIYEDFVDFWFRLLYSERTGEDAPTSEEMMRAMVDFTRASTVWASDEVIRKWGEARRRLGALDSLAATANDNALNPDAPTALFIFEEFLLAIRKDTGYPRTALKKGDLLGMFINDIDTYLVNPQSNSAS